MTAVVLTICPPIGADTLHTPAPQAVVIVEQEPEAPAPEPEPELVSEPAPAENSGAVTLTGVAMAIADCESGVYRADGTAVPGSYGTHLYNQQGSSASGYFHFIDGTWRWIAGEIGAEQYARAVDAPLAVQLRAFEYLYDGGRGAFHWNASRSCWG